jgi:hypothetical protein
MARTNALASRAALALLLASLTACDIGQTCDQEPPTPAGDLDRIGDAVLVSPPPSSGDFGQRSWVVMSNPEIEQLRVFDVLERQFVRAPNVFFPLSLRTGPATRRLSSVRGDATLVLALDASDDTLSVVTVTPHQQLREGELSPDFRVAHVAPTGRAPGDVAALRTDDALLAFVTLPDEGALQVLSIDVAGDTSSELARVDLGDGAHPARVDVDPTGDAVVVTDARLSSIAIVRVDDLALDRRIDVGGATGPVAIGRVDPGDGLAPVALVARRDAPELAAVRLRRPLFREEPYALIARLEIHDFAAALHVNDAARAAPSACCDIPSNAPEGVLGDTPTFAWGSFVGTNGIQSYVLFDGARGGEWTGTRVQPRPPSARGLMRLVSYDEPAPFVATAEWQPAEEGDPAPSITVAPVDNLGDPPLMPLHVQTQTLTLTYEGTPPGGNNRRATIALDGDRWQVTVNPDSVAFDQRDVRDGDVIQVDTANVGGTCPSAVGGPISDLDENTFYLDDLSDEHAACVAAGDEFRFTLFAADSFLVALEGHGYRGRLPRSDVGQSLEVPGWVVTITALAAPTRGSKHTSELSQGFLPLENDLARPPDFQVDGFGTLGLLPSAIISGAVEVRDSDTGDIVPKAVMFVATGTGALLEMEEGEVDVAGIRLHR